MRCAGITSVIAVEWYLPQAYVEKTEAGAAGYSDIPLSDQPARGAAKAATAAEAGNASAEAATAAAAEPDTTGLVVCLLLFFVHYYNFAVQETITTPFVLAVSPHDTVGIWVAFSQECQQDRCGTGLQLGSGDGQPPLRRRRRVLPRCVPRDQVRRESRPSDATPARDAGAQRNLRNDRVGRYLSRCCSDHALIVVSVLMGMVGSFLLVDSL